jgi:hypothetical protein
VGPSLADNLPPAGPTLPSQPGWTFAAAPEQVFATRDAPQPLDGFMDDLALAAWSADGLAPAAARR